ncbi:hypothetical protein Cylst_3330 [Cylindrospermum stagnale PCC 7417]|uniref:Uncharacterized protein n=1 Tax=Cylindrospermum stagnale PCC 7417 TaxID=56107 RepID=K9X160_9NOST|nr:hypothetical protein [Cylindrospermum stagnale]AFZ25482.1 hypothetical protein Cylst_3330 [Cylindrospermum stagnale PCC 7417]
MRLIKKSEKLLLDQIKTTEESKELNLEAENLNIEEPTVEEQLELDIEYEETNYIPSRDNPVVLSVGRTGWQVSDIWKDIRLDNF